MKEVERDGEMVEGEKKKKKRLHLGKASRIKKKSFQKILLPDCHIRRIYTSPVLGRWGEVWGSVVRSGNLSKTTSKKSPGSLLSQRCISLCQRVSCCDHKFQFTPGEITNASTQHGVGTRGSWHSCSGEGRERTSGAWNTCACIFQLSHTHSCVG